MKKIGVFILLLTTFVPACAQNLLPQPRQMTLHKGSFNFEKSYFNFQVADSLVQPFKTLLTEDSILPQPAEPKTLPINVVPLLGASTMYAMEVTPDSITLRVSNYESMVNAYATLRQLMQNGRIPCCRIVDYPAMNWRGAMIDVSRHFFPLSFLKKQIDVMSRFKLNSLHLHLTDAAGWRMEIKQYPRLTQLAAWRKPGPWKPWWNGGRQYVEEHTDGAYGGYYTQNELRDLVAYAARRGINIVPEIEMPAHSEEVLTAYPQYSCTHELYKQADFCPGNGSTYIFLKNILKEVMAVFPSPYIHIGGDEAGKASWAACPRCKQLMAKEHISGLEALQGYFVRRMAQFVEESGRKPIGWDEILSDSLGAGTTVMVWRDAKAAQEAAKKGLPVILSPGSHYYLDGYQDAPPTQPEAIGGYATLERVYSFKPMEALKPEQSRFLTGIQGNLWTEYIPTPADAERMLYPRLLAIADVAWNGASSTDYKTFRKKALNYVTQLHRRGVNAFDLAKEYGQRKEYNQTVKHLAQGKKVTYNVPLKPNYRASGETTLTDGKQGGWSYGDGRWQGFIGGKCLDVTIDLGKTTKMKSIMATFLQSCGPEIYFPEKVYVLVSNDNVHFTQIAELNHPLQRSDLLEMKPFGYQGKTFGRYVRFEAETGQSGGWLFTDEIIVK